MTRVAAGALVVVLVTLASALPCGCNRAAEPAPFSSGEEAEEGKVSLSRFPSGSEAPCFAGLTSLLAGPDWIRVSWGPGETPRPPLRYRIYVADSPGKQDFSAEPFVTTPPDATHVRLPGLPPGEPLHIVVRAVDSAGREDGNTVEGWATPNPVFLVDPQAEGAAADGRTPESAFNKLDAALEACLGLPGANVYLARGTYRERVILFGGLMLYGGFGRDFDVETRVPEPSGTKLVATHPGDVVVIPPGKRISGLDALSLEGGGTGERGVVAEDCTLRISNCSFSGFRRKGIHLKTDEEEGSEIDALITGSVFRSNAGEGLAIETPGDIRIIACRFADNGQEGIEVERFTVARDEKSEISIERSQVLRNAGIGVEFDLAALPSRQSRGGSFRITVEDCSIRENGDHGLTLEINYDELDEIDLRAKFRRVEVSANAKAGIQIDGDAPAEFRVERSVVAANREAGISLTGGASGALYHIRHSRLLGNLDAGIQVLGTGSVLVDHCSLRLNGTTPVRASSAYLSIRNSVLEGDGSTDDPVRFDAHVVEGCLLGGLAPVASAISEDCVAGPALLEHQPEGYATVEDATSAERWRLRDRIELTLGTTVELRDDGVARQVTAVTDDEIVVAPAPARPPRSGDRVALWGNQTDVEEDDTPAEGSLARGDVRADHKGPSGGLPGSPPGPHLCPDPQPNLRHLARISPSPLLPLVEARWYLRFDGSPEGRVKLVLWRGEEKLPITVEKLGSRELIVSSPHVVEPGERLVLELAPASPSSSPFSPARFRFRGGQRMRPGSTSPVSHLSAEARLEAGESHVYTVEVREPTPVRLVLERSATLARVRLSGSALGGAPLELSAEGAGLEITPVALRAGVVVLEVAAPPATSAATYRVGILPETES